MAKKQITAQMIVDAALQVIEEQGMDALNARSVAQRCGCSTQPIYLCFANLGQLKQAAVEQMQALYDRYIADEIASNAYPAYKASGMGYIRYAKEHPNFFKYLFMRDRTGESRTEDAYHFRRESKLAKGYGLSDDEADRMHAHMWIYVHGIATMYATNYFDWDWQTVSAMLTEEFMSVKDKLFGGKQ